MLHDYKFVTLYTGNFVAKCPKCRKGNLIKGNLEEELRQWKCDKCGELLYWHIKKHTWLDRDYQPLYAKREKGIPWGYYMIVILSGILFILLFVGHAGITIILTISLGWIFFIVALILISAYLSERRLKKSRAQ